MSIRFTNAFHSTAQASGQKVLEKSCTTLSALFQIFWNFELARAGSEEVAESRFESRSGVEYELQEDEIQSRGLSWLQMCIRAASSSGLRGSEILWPSGVKIFHKSDSSLFTSLVDSRLLSLCAPFFTSCEAVEYVETGRWCKERPGLPVSLMMAIHALWLECENSMELTALSRRFCFFCPSRDVGTKRLYQSQSSLGLEWRNVRGSSTLYPSMAHSSSDGHVGYILWPRIVSSRKNPGMPSQCLTCPEVAISQRIHLWESKSLSNQSCEGSNPSPDYCGQEPWASVAFQGKADVVTAVSFLGRVLRTRLSGSRLSWPKLAKPRSGLVPEFHRWEKKLTV